MGFGVKSRCLAAILASLSAGCAVPIVDDQPAPDAAIQAAALEAAGISVVREELGAGRVRLLVRPDDVARAFATVARREHATTSWIPTERDAHTALEARRAGDVERLVWGLPGVTRATVSLSLPLRDPLARDAPGPPRATVVVRAASELTDDRVRQVVAGAVEGLRPDQITVDVAREAPRVAPSPLSLVGPFVVTTRSAGPLRATLAVLLGTMAIASSLFAWSRLRRHA